MQDEKQFTLWDQILKHTETARILVKSRGKKRVKPVAEKKKTNYLDMSVDYYKNLRQSKKDQKPIVMTNFCFPPELIYALDCYPMCQEIGSVALSFTREVLRYIDIAEENGIDSAQCNAQKVWIGASMLGEAPVPDYIVYGSQPCDSTNAQYQVLHEIYPDKPTFTIDIPYWHYDQENNYFDPKTLPYVAQQLKNLIHWLEKRINRKMDHERFTSIIQNSNKTRELILETMELMKAVPAPLASGAAVNNYGVLLTCGGLPEAVEYATTIRDVAKRRVKEKRGAMASQGLEEKVRVMWVYLPVFFDIFIFNWMERKFGATTIMDMLGYTKCQLINMKDDNSIYEGLATQVLDVPMGRQSRGPADYYLDDLMRIGKDYKADCAIYGGHMGCKHSHAMAMMMKEVIEEELGIPCLTFELDCIDSRPVTNKEVKQKLKLFFESLK